MKKLFVAVLFAFVSISFPARAQQEPVSDYTIDLARMFGREIFELNGVPYLSPMVEAVNATSNARFFNSAFIPKDPDGVYVKFGIHAMAGMVREDMKTFAPKMPAEEFVFDTALKFIEFRGMEDVFIKDTAGLINYLFKTVLYDGLEKGSFVTPESASTVLGNKDTVFTLPTDTLAALVREHPGYQFLPKNLQDSLTKIIGQFPQRYPLYPGGNINTVLAAVPQIEIGSLFGTEILLRLVPPIDLGKYIGEFAFWGVGLKHSISQYLPERWFDAAAQVVWQGTSLKNFVGTTNAELRANANLWNMNLHFSKEIEGWLDIYTGVSYEIINISSSFKYYLPGEVQYELGLVADPANPQPSPGYPGDTKPQVTHIALQDDNMKWTIGLYREFGPFAIFADYSVSQFNIFSGGIQYTFGK
ncbi:MAG: DUF6588 family protein [Candidatus Kapaibacterium sp.]